MGNSITKETFQGADRDTQMGILFDLQVETCKHVKILQKKKKIDRWLSFGGGILGGAVAVFAKMAIWRQP